MPGDEQQQEQEPPPLAFPPRAQPASASLGLMQLTLATEDLCASRVPETAQKKRVRTRSKHATAALVDELPSPVSSASSKDYATAKRRGFSAPSLKRSVTAVARMTDRLPSIPSLSRSASTEAQVEPAASAAAPVLQRAKTESEGASSGRTIAMVNLQSTKAGQSQAATRTASFRSLKRSEKASKSGDHGAQPNFEPEGKLCPLDSPVGPASTAGSMTYETPSKPNEADVKTKRRFAPSIPSLMRTSSKDNAKPPPTPEPPTQELPPPVTIAVSPPTQESKAASHSPKEPVAKETPKRTKRKFVMPSLRRSSTSSSEKSVSSFVVPSSDAAAGSNPPGSSSDESTMESPLEEDDDAEQESDEGATKSQKFGIPSLFRSLTGTSNMKRKSSDSKMEDRQAAGSVLPSPGQKSSAPATTTQAQTQPPSPVASAKSRKSMLPPVPSSTKAAARFFSGMKPMFQRSVSTAKGGIDKSASASPKKAKTPSTAEEDLSDTNASDEEEEAKEMRSLLSMLQVPRGRRESTAPLMSTGEEEVSF
jgi:hypothetical protein